MQLRRAYQQYCSKPCARASYTALETAHRVECKAGRKCETCGSEIDPRRRKDARFCCAVCRDHEKHRRRSLDSLPAGSPKRKLCPHCGNEFRAIRVTQVHCCRDCKNAAARKAAMKPCQHCGKVFPHPSHKTRFCSLTCSSHAIWASGLCDHRRGRLNAKAFDRMFG